MMKPCLQKHHFIGTLLIFFFAISFYFAVKNSCAFYHSEKTYRTTLKKIKALEKLTNEENLQKAEAASKQSEASLKKLLSYFHRYQIILPPELAAASPSVFQDHLQYDVLALQKKAAQNDVAWPSRFFLALNQYENSPPSANELKKASQQEIILNWIAQKITEHRELTLQQFELQSSFEPDSNDLFSSLGLLTIHFTSDELSFQKLFNELVQAPYFFTIKTITVENSQPTPPAPSVTTTNFKRPSCITSEPSIKIIFGNEKVTVKMQLELLDVHVPKEETIAMHGDVEDKLIWQRSKDDAPLFVSRPYFIRNGLLVDLLEEKTALHPPVPNQWLIDHHLDYSDPNILSEDPDHDGFTNLEEWLGSAPLDAPGVDSSNPNDPTSRPLLWTKLHCTSSDVQKNNYHFEFTGYETEGSQKVFQLQPKTPTPNINTHGKSVLNRKVRYATLGQKLDELPLAIFSFQEKQTNHQGVFYDTSELTLMNNETGEKWTLIKKSTLHPDSTMISVLSGICFHYDLPSPPQLVKVTCGNEFSLESLPLPENTTHPGQKEIETYQLIAIKNNEVELKKEGVHYAVPIANNEPLQK